MSPISASILPLLDASDVLFCILVRFAVAYVNVVPDSV